MDSIVSKKKLVSNILDTRVAKINANNTIQQFLEVFCVPIQWEFLTMK